MSQGARKRLSRFLEESSLIRYYLWKYKRWITIGLCSLILVDFLEIIPPIFLKRVVDITVERGSVRLLTWMALSYICISLVQGLGRYGWRMYLIRSSIFAGRDLRSKYAEHLFGLSVSFFDRRRMGDLMSLATNDVEAVRIAIGTGLLVFADALFYLLTVPIAMYLLSPKLTFLTCIPMLLIPWIVLRNEKKINQRFEKVQESFSKISSITQENLNGVRVVKAFARENTQIKRIQDVGEEYVQLNLSLARVQSAMGPSLDFVMSLGLVILLFVGGASMIETDEQAITLGTFVAFQRYIQKMVWPMSAVGMAINYYQRAISSTKRLNGIFSLTTDVPDTVKSKNTKKMNGAIEFKNLSFSFPGSNRAVLSQIDLKIEVGERIAFVGAIGAGKSAILSLLPRLYPIERGMLWIDGIDINDWSIEDLRRQVGYVSQEVFLFSETVMDNVGFGLHEWIEIAEHRASLELRSIEEATRLASVHEEISELALAYKTRLGERGINLSGGQKQRLTIARALAKQPAILVLDDALSSVDIQTEEKILRSLRCRAGRNTEIISAHRISTIKDADRIVVLDSGKIVQTGTHSKLIQKRDSIYWKFYEQQQLMEDLESYQNELN